MIIVSLLHLTNACVHEGREEGVTHITLSRSVLQMRQKGVRLKVTLGEPSPAQNITMLDAALEFEVGFRLKASANDRPV